jgi:hypothetical protein
LYKESGDPYDIRSEDSPGHKHDDEFISQGSNKINFPNEEGHAHLDN